MADIWWNWITETKNFFVVLSDFFVALCVITLKITQRVTKISADFKEEKYKSVKKIPRSLKRLKKKCLT